LLTSLLPKDSKKLGILARIFCFWVKILFLIA